MFRTGLTLALCAVLAGIATMPASAQGKLRTFREIRGQIEFTGQMIAKPRTLADLEAETGDPYRAEELRQLARSAFTKNTIRYYPEVDEYVVKVPFGFDENSYQAYLMGTGAFEYVSPNYRTFPLATPNDPQYGSQWHLPKIQMPRVWDNFTGSGSLIVAICDTGCDLAHQDLAGKYVSGYNSVSHLAQSAGGLVTPVHPHGTHCAGIVGAIGNNAVGVSGVAWDIRIMPVRISNVSSGSSSIAAMNEGARWAADNGARIVSMSYSGVDDPSFQTTGAYIKARNALYFFAAGNDNRNLTGFDHADVIVVGATDSADAKASFSAYGPGVDVFAPGVGILSTTPGNNYESWNGTSMATPCAAAVGAMIMIANPGLTPNQVEGFLTQHCDDLGAVGNDSYWGWGRVNAFRSVANAVSTIKYYPSTGHYYERVTWPATWAQANTGAVARSHYGVAGHLAAVNSSGENTFIVNNLDTNFTRSHYLGGTQPGGSVEPAGGWQWVTGEAWSYTSWNPGEPNNSAGEDKLEYWSGGSLGGWNDINGATVNSGYIVEYPVPPPSTLSGTVTLQDYSGSIAGIPVLVELKQSGVVKASFNTTLNGAGLWSVSTPWVGTFDVFVKPSHWLKKRQGSTFLNNAVRNNLNTSNINGDLNNDNGVDVADYAIMSSAYNLNGNGDLDGDGWTDIADYAILSARYGLDGDD